MLQGTILCALLLPVFGQISESIHEISDVGGYGRTFDGIGAISGGGATSRLLVNYPNDYRDQVLDYLFKPNFGASLQILKVEIGGDSQTTDGTEPSHMHTEDETPNFNRGYEWWLMKEAKSRNPNIKLAALPWSWPGWLKGNGSTPYTNVNKTAEYVTTWVLGAASEHNLTIDYIGIWNERNYDKDYIKALRRTLDDNDLQSVTIVAADGWISSTIGLSIQRDPELETAVGVIGTHYPGTLSNPTSVDTGKPLWASEDYSTYNNYVGAGCWARILNRNYVHGNMTATIAWNLVASYYDNLPYNRTSLMTANEPWSGHYEVPETIWITAHTTQFTEPGWSYLTTVGELTNGGSYVALTDGKGALTIVVETMTHDHSACIRPATPNYSVEPQSITFMLGGSFEKVTKLYTWFSQLGQSTSDGEIFVEKTVDVNRGRVTMNLSPDTVVTLTTLSTGFKGNYNAVPPSMPFPLPYEDEFNDTGEFSEASNFADQSGSFETYHNKFEGHKHEWTMRQVVPERPLTWCDDSESPITVIGDYAWSDVNVTVDVDLENSTGVFVAARVATGGCEAALTKGVFFWLKANGTWTITRDLRQTEPVSIGYYEVTKTWTTMSIVLTNSTFSGYLNSQKVFDLNDTTEFPTNGWAALGVEHFAYAQFDNFSVRKS